MSRKIKLYYPFDTTHFLEVEHAPDKWARVTANHFRSFLGARRINGESFIGPFYYEGTNTMYEPKEDDQTRLISIEELNNVKLRDRLRLTVLEVEGPRRYESF